jgi:hypothetical protein
VKVSGCISILLTLVEPVDAPMRIARKRIAAITGSQ